MRKWRDKQRNGSVTLRNTGDGVGVGDGVGIPEGGCKGGTDPALRFTLADCQQAAEGVGMTGKQIEAFFTHYAGVNFVDGAGRKIVSLKHALAKWKTQDGQRTAPGQPKHDPYAACLNLKVPEPQPGMEGWSEPR